MKLRKQIKADDIVVAAVGERAAVPAIEQSATDDRVVAGASIEPPDARQTVIASVARSEVVAEEV